MRNGLRGAALGRAGSGIADAAAKMSPAYQCHPLPGPPLRAKFEVVLTIYRQRSLIMERSVIIQFRSNLAMRLQRSLNAKQLREEEIKSDYASDDWAFRAVTNNPSRRIPLAEFESVHPSQAVKEKLITAGSRLNQFVKDFLVNCALADWILRMTHDRIRWYNARLKVRYLIQRGNELPESYSIHRASICVRSPYEL